MRDQGLQNKKHMIFLQPLFRFFVVHKYKEEEVQYDKN